MSEGLHWSVRTASVPSPEGGDIRHPLVVGRVSEGMWHENSSSFEGSKPCPVCDRHGAGPATRPWIGSWWTLESCVTKESFTKNDSFMKSQPAPFMGTGDRALEAGEEIIHATPGALNAPVLASTWLSSPAFCCQVYWVSLAFTLLSPELVLKRRMSPRPEETDG